VAENDYSPSMLIPVFFEEQLMPGTLEFAIHTLVETQMDMSILDDYYAYDQTGRRAYDPKILLKVVLFAYSRGLISSRKIERACRENVTFMALLGNQRPDHSTIITCDSVLSGNWVFALDHVWDGRHGAYQNKHHDNGDNGRFVCREHGCRDNEGDPRVALGAGHDEIIAGALICPSEQTAGQQHEAREHQYTE
jgi:hypothetical protein